MLPLRLLGCPLLVGDGEAFAGSGEPTALASTADAFRQLESQAGRHPTFSTSGRLPAYGPGSGQ